MGGGREQSFKVRIVGAIRRRLRKVQSRLLGPDPLAAEFASLRGQIGALEERLTYVHNEISEGRQHLRILLGDSDRFHASMNQTRSSFDTQWDILPEGAHLATDDAFVANASRLIETYTQLPAEWFKGKTVLDAGCGNGRWAYAFSRLGAHVTAVDQSDHGLQNVRRLCESYSGFRHRAVNLLEPLPFDD